ncbi:LrgB family protein [Paenibacillus chartarius]|uniref:LrgB family protein n=1 Tax=Paenibacillus chartarius TaxID=747481 RepID=A0ABV6DPL1_9BACL
MLALVCFVITVAIYVAAKKLYRRIPVTLLTPLLTVPIAVVAIVLLFGIPYDTYAAGTQWITDMVGPGTVALAVPLYKNIGVLKKHAVTIGVSVGSGAVVAVLTSAWIADWLQLNAKLIDSLSPRSATTPIAMAISGQIGGIPSITAVFVLLTGLSGMIIGPLAVRALRIQNEVARGVLFGTSSHNAGTAKAFELGPVSGSIASIAMVLTAIITLCTAPILIRWIS